MLFPDSKLPVTFVYNLVFFFLLVQLCCSSFNVTKCGKFHDITDQFSKSPVAYLHIGAKWSVSLLVVNPCACRRSSKMELSHSSRKHPKSPDQRCAYLIFLSLHLCEHAAGGQEVWLLDMLNMHALIHILWQIVRVPNRGNAPCHCAVGRSVPTDNKQESGCNI